MKGWRRSLINCLAATDKCLEETDKGMFITVTGKLPTWKIAHIGKLPTLENCPHGKLPTVENCPHGKLPTPIFKFIHLFFCDFSD